MKKVLLIFTLLSLVFPKIMAGDHTEQQMKGFTAITRANADDVNSILIDSMFCKFIGDPQIAIIKDFPNYISNTTTVFDITQYISATSTGGAVIQIDDLIRNGSQLIWQFSNRSSERVTLKSMQLIDGSTGSAGNIMSVNQDVEANSSVAYTTTIGGSGIHVPVTCRFIYIYDGNEYSTDAVYSGSGLTNKYTLSIKVSGNGQVTYNGETIRNTTETYSLEWFSSATLIIMPDSGCQIKSVKEDNNDITWRVNDNSCTFYINKDLLIEIEFEAIPVIPTKTDNLPNGFYRLQNKTTGRNVAILNDKIHLDTNNEFLDALKNTTSVDVYALETKDEFLSDPASIVYLENVTDREFNIKGQGIDIKSLTTGLSWKVYQSEDYYELYATEDGFTVYLKDNNLANNTANGYCSVSTGENGNCQWAINPIDENNYFGINPELNVGNKYYTTFYAAFAIQLSSNMKAYYVKETSGKAAELIEIGSDIVPEETPVIIECSSNNPANNKVVPIIYGGTKLTDNHLKGVYFSYVSLNGRRTTEDPNNKYYSKLKNAIEYENSMRILGIVDGKLSLVKATEADLYMKKYLPANKAYIVVENSAEGNLPLLDEDAYNETTRKYSLIYMVDDVEYNSYLLDYGTKIIPEEEPKKEGYTFSGWSSIPETMPAKDVIVIGTFTINKYNLTYIVDGEVYKSYEMDYSATITPEAEPKKDGYKFSGWSYIPSKMPAEDVVVTGYFTFDGVVKNDVAYAIEGDNASVTHVDNAQGEIKIESSVVLNGQTYQVTTIAEGAFQGCTGLTSVEIPNSVTTIGQNAFNGCSGLLIIKIGNGVKDIGSKAFANIATNSESTRAEDTGLKIYCETEVIPSTAADAFENSPIDKGTLIVKDEMVMVYKYLVPWNGFGSIIGLTTDIRNVAIDADNAFIFDMQGNRIDEVRKGVNIIRTRDGKTKKLMVK